MSDMADINAEPFAFPSQIGFGMTLRDYFAGQCLAAIARSDINTDGSRKGVAEWAYAAADAMLAERAK